MERVTEFLGPNWLDGYMSRVRKCFEITDMRTLLVTRADLNNYLHIIEHSGEYSKAEVEYAVKVRDSMVHPDTKEIIPLPFRMAAAVPMNIGIVAGMLTVQSLAGMFTFSLF